MIIVRRVYANVAVGAVGLVDKAFESDVCECRSGRKSERERRETSCPVTYNAMLSYLLY